MINHQFKIVLLICAVFGLQTPTINAQFIDTFTGETPAEWATFSGAGEAVSNLERMDGWLQFTVDATDDTQNVWWAIAQTTLTDQLDLNPFADNESEYRLRMEARVRISHAPRRFNMQLRTQRYEENYAGLMAAPFSVMGSPTLNPKHISLNFRVDHMRLRLLTIHFF